MVSVRGFISIVTLAEIVWVMSSNYAASRARRGRIPASKHFARINVRPAPE
jgi:hypothetical protein